jgi:hypothetical protein
MARPALWNDVFILRATLRRIEPRIWRTVQVPALYSLADLHQVLQVTFGWKESHLHDFDVGDVRFGMADVEDELLAVDERFAPLGAIAAEGTAFVYRYDYGDDWKHDVFVERVIDARSTWDVEISCLGGARACPPEDCGGPPGYARMLEILADPRHEEHREIRTWVGKKYESEFFDITAVNRKLSALGKRLGRDLQRREALRRRPR